MSSLPSPTENNLQTAAQQFVAASMALVSAVQKVERQVDQLDVAQNTTNANLGDVHEQTAKMGAIVDQLKIGQSANNVDLLSIREQIAKMAAFVDQLKATQATTGPDLVTIHEQLGAVAGKVHAIETKPPDKWKAFQTWISLLALFVAAMSAYFSITYGGVNLDRSKKASDLENRNRTEAVQNDILDRIARMETAAREAQTSPQAYVLMKGQYDALVNQIENIRTDHGLSAIGERNFARLMRAIFSFGDKEYAKQMWLSVASIQAAGVDASWDLALVHAQYAKLMQLKDEMGKAANRLDALWQDLEPNQKLRAHVEFAEMFESLSPKDAMGIHSERGEIAEAEKVMASQRTSKPDFGKDYNDRIAALKLVIQQFDLDEEVARKRREEQKAAEAKKATAATRPFDNKKATNGRGGH